MSISETVCRGFFYVKKWIYFAINYIMILICR